MIADVQRWRSLPGLLLLGWVLLSLSCKTPPASAPTTLPAANIPAEVAAEFQRSIAAWNSGNLDLFISIYAEQSSFSLADDLLVGREAIREFYAPNFNPRALRQELLMEEFNVEVLCPEAVLVRGIYNNRVAGRVTRRGVTTVVMRRILGQWRIIHDHSN
jgi:uncharacterized protein (TIGR02246 family)